MKLKFGCVPQERYHGLRSDIVHNDYVIIVSPKDAPAYDLLDEEEEWNKKVDKMVWFDEEFQLTKLSIKKTNPLK